MDESIFVGFCEFAYTGHYRSRMKDAEPEGQSNNDATIEEEAAPVIAASQGGPMLAEVEEVFDAPVGSAVTESPPQSTPELGVYSDQWCNKKRHKKKRNQAWEDSNEDSIPVRSKTEQL